MTGIAVLGTGQMGAAIARRLLDTGHPVTVWNRTTARTSGFAEVAPLPAVAEATKLMINTAMLTALGALRDTIAVAERVGVDRKAALDILAAGPLAVALDRATATGAAFAVDLAAKDLALALRDLDHVPVAAATLRLLRGAEDQRADVATIVEREQP